ncbi:MAG: hypothetical protein CML05_14270 [Pseudozobellia sp.]|nr:hypothetical protein [Pseudozobellia sp.]|tara:strand:- start:366535 stop:367722 length:1188 start_codon:yes stop_codon:yes gene_type:complete
MKKNILFITAVTLLTACGGLKKTQKALNIGDYNQAIYTSIDNLAKNKGKKSNQPYILLLEEAYRKNTERELERIEFLKEDESPVHFEEIYNSYVNLNTIQERIKPLLPLQVQDEHRKAKFVFNNYNDEIIDSKDDLAEYLYDNATSLLQSASTKQDYRQAYDDLAYLNEIEPGFDDTRQKMQEAFEKGLDYVRVDLINETEQIIPARLEQEMLNFDIYGLNQLWTKFHTNPQAEIDYDYHMNLAFKSILISPERISEQQLIKERQIKDGYKYATDRQGNILKDSLGNKIKIDRFKTVKCNFYQFTQLKTAQVSGMVEFTDLRTKQPLQTYPLTSEFIFEHNYANYDGDKRALENDLVRLVKLKEVPFPTNEQMVYDAGEDLKNRLKSILQRQKFN